MRDSQSIWCCRHCHVHNEHKAALITHISKKYVCSTSLNSSEAHICDRHSIEVPGDTDMFRKADQSFDAVRCPVYLVPDEYKQNQTKLLRDVVEALETGRAVYESEYLANTSTTTTDSA